MNKYEALCEIITILTQNREVIIDRYVDFATEECFLGALEGIDKNIELLTLTIINEESVTQE